MRFWGQPTNVAQSVAPEDTSCQKFQKSSSQRSEMNLVDYNHEQRA